MKKSGWIRVAGILILVLSACQLGGNQAVTEIQSSAVIGGDVETQIALENGALLSVPPGNVAVGTTVALRRLDSAEWTSPAAEGVTTGPIYEIVAGGWEPGMQAVLTLPVESDVEGGLENVSIAYWGNGKWNALPTSPNAEGDSVSATLTHFSFYTWMLRKSGINKPPFLAVDVSPSVFNWMDAGTIKEIVVDIYASDPDGKPITVGLSVGISDFAFQQVMNLQEKKAFIGSLMVFSTMTSGYEVGTSAKILKDWVAAPPDKNAVYTDYYELTPVEPGHYSFSFNIEGATVDWDGVHFSAVVLDDLKEEPVVVSKFVRQTSLDVPSSPILNGPGPLPEWTCPSRPNFSWFVPTNPDRIEASRFRLSNGDDPWAALFPEVDWTCTKKGCNGANANGQLYDFSWTPEKPLSKGQHSWGVAFSSDLKDGGFSGPLSSRSSIFKFTVDPDMQGTDCVWDQGGGQLEKPPKQVNKPEPQPACTPDADNGCVKVRLKKADGSTVTGGRVTLHLAMDPVSSTWSTDTDENGEAVFITFPGAEYYLWAGYVPDHMAWSGENCTFVAAADELLEKQIDLMSGNGTSGCADAAAAGNPSAVMQSFGFAHYDCVTSIRYSDTDGKRREGCDGKYVEYRNAGGEVTATSHSGSTDHSWSPASITNPMPDRPIFEAGMHGDHYWWLPATDRTYTIPENTSVDDNGHYTSSHSEINYAPAGTTSITLGGSTYNGVIYTATHEWISNNDNVNQSGIFLHKRYQVTITDIFDSRSGLLLRSEYHRVVLDCQTNDSATWTACANGSYSGTENITIYELTSTDLPGG